MLFRAFGRDFFAAFFFVRAFGFADREDSSLPGIDEGVGAGVGAEGNIGSMNPGPGQLLSWDSICSRIGALLFQNKGRDVAYSLPPDLDLASDSRYRALGLTKSGVL
jgi:hypothetical protein